MKVTAQKLVSFFSPLFILGVAAFSQAAHSSDGNTETNQPVLPATQNSQATSGDPVKPLLISRNIKGWWNGTSTSGTRYTGIWQLAVKPNLVTGKLDGHMTFEGQSSACPFEKIPVLLSVEGKGYLLKGEGCGTTFEGKMEPREKETKLGGIFNVTITSLKW